MSYKNQNLRGALGRPARADDRGPSVSQRCATEKFERPSGWNSTPRTGDSEPEPTYATEGGAAPRLSAEQRVQVHHLGGVASGAAFAAHVFVGAEGVGGQDQAAAGCRLPGRGDGRGRRRRLPAAGARLNLYDIWKNPSEWGCSGEEGSGVFRERPIPMANGSEKMRTARLRVQFSVDKCQSECKNQASVSQTEQLPELRPRRPVCGERAPGTERAVACPNSLLA